MMQMIATLIYVGAALFAGAVLAAALLDARGDIARALLGERTASPDRVRVVARRPRVRAIRLRPVPLASVRVRAAA